MLYRLEIDKKPKEPISFCLWEKINEHPKLEVRCYFDENKSNIQDLIYAEVKLFIENKLIFYGNIGKVIYDSELCQLFFSAWTKTKFYNLAKQTMIYGEGDIQRPVKELISPLLNKFNVSQTDLMVNKSYILYQNNEKPFYFLAQILGEENKAAYVEANTDKTFISDGNPTKTSELQKKDIISCKISSSIKSSDFELKTWNTTNGKKSEPVIGKMNHHNSKILSTLYKKTKPSSKDRNQLFAECIENTSQLIVNGYTNSKLSSLFKISLTTSVYNLSVGDGITISNHPLQGEKLLICSSVLSYDPLNHINQLKNDVECRIVTGNIPFDFVKKKQEYSQLLLGQVLSVNDPVKIGRVKVHFPFNTDNSGVWCRTLHASNRQFIIPKPNEFVYVIINSETSLPVVLGSINKTNSLPPAEIEDPEADLSFINPKDKDFEIYVKNGTIFLTSKKGITIIGDTNIYGKVNIKEEK